MNLDHNTTPYIARDHRVVPVRQLKLRRLGDSPPSPHANESKTLLSSNCLTTIPAGLIRRQDRLGAHDVVVAGVGLGEERQLEGDQHVAHRGRRVEADPSFVLVDAPPRHPAVSHLRGGGAETVDLKRSYRAHRDLRPSWSVQLGRCPWRAHWLLMARSEHTRRYRQKLSINFGSTSKYTSNSDCFPCILYSRDRCLTDCFSFIVAIPDPGDSLVKYTCLLP
jgi:hypothetical protein